MAIKRVTKGPQVPIVRPIQSEQPRGEGVKEDGYRKEFDLVHRNRPRARPDKPNGYSTGRKVQ